MTHASTVTTIGKPIHATDPAPILGSYAAEEMLLGLVFSYGTAGLEAALAEGLRPVDFFSEQYGWIFEAMLEVYHAYQDIGYITISDRLTIRGQLDKLSWGEDQGDVVLTRLLITPGILNNSVRGCAGEIRDYAVRRRMAAQAAALAQAAYDRSVPTDLQIARHESAVQKIRPFNPNAVFVRGDDSTDLHRAMLEEQAKVTVWHTIPWSSLAARVPVIMDGDLVVVVGPEGSGKSALLMNWAEHEARQNGAAYIHTEMNKTQVFNRRLTANSKALSWAKLQKPSELKAADWEALQKASAEMETWLSGLHYWHAGLIEEHKLLTVMQRMVDDLGTKTFVIDYLNDVIPERERNENGASAWRDMLARLEAFNNRNSTVIITAAQLNNEGNAYMIGKALRQKAAVFLKIKPDVLDHDLSFQFDGLPYHYVPGDYQPVMKIAIEKYRGGGRGVAQLLFVGPRYLWADIPSDFDDGSADPGAYDRREPRETPVLDLSGF